MRTHSRLFMHNGEVLAIIEWLVITRVDVSSKFSFVGLHPMPERLLCIGKPAANGKAWAYLKEQGFAVAEVEGLRPSLRALDAFRADLVIVDTVDCNSVNLHRITHAAGRKPQAPFIILLLNNQSSLDEAALWDEYIARPFTPRRLGNVVRKMLDSRRGFVVRLGPLTLDRRTRRVMTPKGLCQLTPKQFQLLDILMKHPGELVTRKQFMQEVWDTTYLGDTRTLDVHMRWLRECIEEDPDHPVFVQTYRGRGYCLNLEGPVEVGGEPIKMEADAGAISPSRALPGV